ncbi:MAG: hypothetical protein QOG67_3800 [Verrucomicrobiota bacterium]|jgi:hypothetical protein
MNPDKLFDYLDGKLSRFEREQLEEQLSRDRELQRELAMARRIHGQMTSESREVLLEGEPLDAARSRRIVRRIAIVFITLLGLNVGAGLWLIARHESRNPNHQLLEAQMREQLTKSLDQASKNNLTPARLGVDEINLPAAPGKSGAVADEVVGIAQRLGGSATKELPDQGRIGVMVDLPPNREVDFRNALATLGGNVSTSPAPPASAGSPPEKKTFIIRVLEPGAKQD